MKMRVIQDDPDEPTTHEDRAEAPVEQERSTTRQPDGPLERRPSQESGLRLGAVGSR